MTDIRTIHQAGLSYSDYRANIDTLLLKGKTTGLRQTKEYIQFTQLNVSRMNRIDKTVTLNSVQFDLLRAVKIKYKLLLISDAWCGDCAQITPLINLISLGADFDLKIVSRDDFPDLLDTFSTNGSKSSPKLIIMESSTYNIIGQWGPRPLPAQKILLEWKQNKDKISHDEFEKRLHLWYSKDKGETTLNEIINLLKQCDERTIS